MSGHPAQGSSDVTPEAIARAAVTLAPHVVHTLSAVSDTLSTITGCQLVIKFENHQFTGSFKDRGSANALQHLTPTQKSGGVIALSAGNHAQGVAYHAGRMGIDATIVMPTSAPFTKVADTRRYGATVVQDGATFSEAMNAAQDLADTHGLTWIHPYADPHVIAGQGTAAVELLNDQPDLDTIVVPCGGGGLLSGMAIWAKHVRPDIEVIGAQSEVYPGMVAALAGQELHSTRTDTVADGIAVKAPAERTVNIVRDLVDDVLVAQESTIEHAVALLIEVEKTVAEGAGATGLAAIVDHPERFAGKRVGMVLSGGNIDSRLLASVLMRELVQTGRITSLRVTIEDLPGQLAPVLELLGTEGANILDIEHRRLFSPLSARRTQIDVTIETRNPAHTQTVIARLTDAGYEVTRPDC